jgi:hypothetical protein
MDMDVVYVFYEDDKIRAPWTPPTTNLFENDLTEQNLDVITEEL